MAKSARLEIVFPFYRGSGVQIPLPPLRAFFNLNV